MSESATPKTSDTVGCNSLPRGCDKNDALAGDTSVFIQPKYESGVGDDRLLELGADVTTSESDAFPARSRVNRFES